jgi:hypothetical protein
MILLARIQMEADCTAKLPPFGPWSPLFPLCHSICLLNTLFFPGELLVGARLRFLT